MVHIQKFSVISKLAKEVIKELVNKEPLSVISITTEDNKPVAVVEVLEREAIPDSQNIIGLYKIVFDKDYNVSSYERTEVRRKSDVGLESDIDLEESAKEVKTESK